MSRDHAALPRGVPAIEGPRSAGSAFGSAHAGVLCTLVVVLLFASSGCGGATPSGATTPQQAPKPAKPGVDPRAFSLRDATALFYVDLERVGGESELIEQLAGDERAGLLMERLDWIEWKCELSPLAIAKEALISSSNDDWMVALRVDDGGVDALDCLSKLVDEPKREEIFGHGAVTSEEWSGVLVDGSLLVVGPDGVLRDVLAETEGIARRPPLFTFDRDETLVYVEFPIEEDDRFYAMSLAVEGSLAEAELRIAFIGVDTYEADRVVTAFRDYRQIIGEDVGLMLASDDVRRRIGNKVEVTLPAGRVDGSFEKPVQVLWQALAIADQEELHRMQADALLGLAETLEQYAVDHPGLGKPAFPPSAPRSKPVMGEEPPDARWAKLDFAMPPGFPVEVEVKTAPGFRRVTAIAYSDFDEDGEELVMTIELSVGATGEVERGEIEVQE